MVLFAIFGGLLIKENKIQLYNDKSETPPHKNIIDDSSVKQNPGISSSFRDNSIPKAESNTSMVDAIAGYNVLAFGDSLTHGLYVDPLSGEWRNTHPYSIAMNKLLKPSSIVVHESGINGESTESMAKRLPITLEKSINTRAVIILGGTNDLARMSADKILSNLIHLHRQAHKHAGDNQFFIYTVALTIPQVSWDSANQTARLVVNKGLRSFAASCSSRVALVDLEDIFDQVMFYFCFYILPPK